MLRYVQHQSGQGEKWEVVNEEPLVYKSYDRGIALSLPKSEYVLCAPPERWVDVTAALGDDVVLLNPRFTQGYTYRLRKVELDCHGTIPGVEGAGHRTQWAFIVERKEP